MGEARLDIRADARELSTAARIMQRFGATGARASRTIKRELNQVGKEIKVLTQDQKRLTAEMLKVEKGSDAYKKLAKQVGAVGNALKEARRESQGLSSAIGKGAGPRGGAAARGASYARVQAQQMIGTIGAAGPEQTYGTAGQFAGSVGTALSNVPIVGAGFGLVGATAQAGLNIMQRRASMLISAQKARQGAGSFIRSGIGEGSVISTARGAAKHGYGAEEAYGIMRSFGQGAGYRAGMGTLELHRMGFGPGAMSAAGLYAAGMGGVGAGQTSSARRGEAGKTFLRQTAAQARLEERILSGKGAEKTITPSTVEQRLTEMVSYLKQMAMEGVAVDPEEFQRQTMQIFSLGLQTQNKDLFAGGRAFKFQTAMREGQKGEGGILNMMAVMSGMRQGKDVIGAMEDARLGRVPMEQMQGQMKRMGVGSQRWMQFMIGKQTGRPMEEIAALAGGDMSLVPQEYEQMRRKGGKALGVFRGGAPVSPLQKGLLGVRADEMEAAKGTATAMINVAKEMVGVQTQMANLGSQAFNALITIAEGLHGMVGGMYDALHELGLADTKMPKVNFSSMKLPSSGELKTVPYSSLKGAKKTGP